MTARAAADVTANVLFLHLRQQGGAPRAHPGGDSEALATSMRGALAPWDARRRVVLQAEGGLAVVGDVPCAVVLDAARRACTHADAAGIGIGVHRGTVRILSESGGARVVGEVLEEAGALARAAGAQPLVAEAFRARLATESAGAARDLHAAEAAAGVAGPVHAYDAIAGGRRKSRRTVMGGLGLGAVLALGWAARLVRENHEAAHRPAILLLDIRPSGEIFVDGSAKGSAPPLTRLSVPPGAHTIEVRNGRFKPLRLEVQLEPGQELPIRHVFAAPPPRRAPPPRQKPGPLERFKFW